MKRQAIRVGVVEDDSEFREHLWALIGGSDPPLPDPPPRSSLAGRGRNSANSLNPYFSSTTGAPLGQSLVVLSRCALPVRSA